jgi:N-terminal half of MaoC dehydratase
VSDEYITGKVKAIIGAQTDWVESTHPVEASEVRRFHHATMDDAPRYWDEEWAVTSRHNRILLPTRPLASPPPASGLSGACISAAGRGTRSPRRDEQA